jgi:hypothetical protein
MEAIFKWDWAAMGSFRGFVSISGSLSFTCETLRLFAGSVSLVGVGGFVVGSFCGG